MRTLMTIISSVLLIILSVATIPAAHAATVTFAYEGIINEADGGAAFDAFLGQILRFEYTFNDTSMGNTDTALAPNQGAYTLSAFSAIVGGNSYSGSNGSIFINDNVGLDTYDVRANGGVGPFIDGIPLSGVNLELSDSTELAISGDDLPLLPPDPFAFDSRRLLLGFNDDPGGDFPRTGNLIANDFRVTPVPIPSAMLLFGTGLFGLVGWRMWSGKK